MAEDKDSIDTIELGFDKVEYESAAARLIDFGDLKVWIPHSQTIQIDEGDRTIVLPTWLAENEGLI